MFQSFTKMTKYFCQELRDWRPGANWTMTLGPIQHWTDSQIDAHIAALTSVDSAKLLFGDRHLTNHSIAECYGTLDAAAMQVQMEALAGAQFQSTVLGATVTVQPTAACAHR